MGLLRIDRLEVEHPWRCIDLPSTVQQGCLRLSGQRSRKLAWIAGIQLSGKSRSAAYSSRSYAEADWVLPSRQHTTCQLDGRRHDFRVGPICTVTPTFRLRGDGLWAGVGSFHAGPADAVGVAFAESDVSPRRDIEFRSADCWDNACGQRLRQRIQCPNRRSFC